MGGESREATLAFISAQGSALAIRRLCAVLKVARSGFHAGRRAAPARAEEAAKEAILAEEIRTAFERGRRRHGAPRLQAELRATGRRASRKRVARLLKENGTSPPRASPKAPVTAG
ncbi:MAG: IS3 family transposase [Chloroflexota bacterium]